MGFLLKKYQIIAILQYSFLKIKITFTDLLQIRAVRLRLSGDKRTVLVTLIQWDINDHANELFFYKQYLP
jgi:hypothetical protein